MRSSHVSLSREVVYAAPWGLQLEYCAQFRALHCKEVTECTEKCNKAGEQTRKQDLQGTAERSGVWFGEKEDRGRPYSSYNFQKGGCSDESFRLFSWVTCDRT